MAKKAPKITVRKPPSPDDRTAAERFVSGSASGAPKASAAAASKSVVTRVDGRELRRMTIYLETKLATRLRVHATTLDVDQSDVIAQALTAWLERSGA